MKRALQILPTPIPAGPLESRRSEEGPVGIAVLATGKVMQTLLCGGRLSMMPSVF